MEQLIETFKVQLRNLVEESEPKFSFDDDIQAIREKFDKELVESNKKLFEDSFRVSPSRLAIQEVKGRINKLATGKIENCLKEINQHIEWAIAQRNEIEQKMRKKLVIDFLALSNDFFEQEMKGFMKRLISRDSKEYPGELRKIANNFQQELKKSNEPAKNLFKKEVWNFIKELRTTDEYLQKRVNDLLKQPKFLIGLNIDMEFHNNTMDKIFTTINTVNESIDRLANGEKELNKNMREDLEANLNEHLEAINEKFRDLFNPLVISDLIVKMESEKDINSFDENCRKQIKTLLNDLTKVKSVIGKSTFNESVIKIISSMVDSEVGQSWNHMCNKTKNNDLINESKFERHYLDLRLDLDIELDQTMKQAEKYYKQFDKMKKDSLKLKKLHNSK